MANDMANDTLDALHRALTTFNADRDWEQFHTPKALAAALSVEASELLELFLWRRDDAPLPDGACLEEEAGDVLICLCNFARAAGIDLIAAANRKLAQNATRYPVATARGKALKYDQLPHTPDPKDQDDAHE